MTQTLRIPIEAKTSRISFQDDIERDEDTIACRYSNEWNIKTDWQVESGLVARPSQAHWLKTQTPTTDWISSFPTKSIEVSCDWSAVDWKKIRAVLHERILLVSDAIEDSSLEAEFNQLASRWYSETRKISSAEQIVLNAHYQKIIGMGKEALPFIFKELKKTRGHWLWALAMILRDDKATPGMKFREAVDAWLSWGENNGYI